MELSLLDIRTGGKHAIYESGNGVVIAVIVVCHRGSLRTAFAFVCQLIYFSE